MSADDFRLEDLSPEIQEKLRELALAMRCSEEELVLTMVRLMLNLSEHPEGQDLQELRELQEFVHKAKESLKQKESAS